MCGSTLISPYNTAVTAVHFVMRHDIMRIGTHFAHLYNIVCTLRELSEYGGGRIKILNPPCYSEIRIFQLRYCDDTSTVKCRYRFESITDTRESSFENLIQCRTTFRRKTLKLRPQS